MITNITQKDMILDELLDYIEQESDIVAKDTEDAHGEFYERAYAAGRYRELGEIKEWVQEYYGYTGEMPLEEPNHSK